MFKLFGKKEEERERPVSTASRHPEAAALSAQFGREEFDILAVTGANSFGGDREPEAEYWTATLPITAWREDDGPIHQEETCLVALADDKVLAYLRRVAPRDSIIQARVRQSLVDDRFLLVGMPTPMMDRELKAILDEQVKPVSTWVPDLGTFVLNRSVNWFQADVEWQGQSVQLVYDQGSEEEMRAAQETAKALMDGQAEWDQTIRAYAAGELKHGTISLIEDGTLVVALATQPALFQKTISNMVEVKARGAFVMAVTNEGNKEIEKASDYVIYIPETNPYFTNSLAIIPLQLFAYYVAVGRGCDVDKPRNLAKSVTVE